VTSSLAVFEAAIWVKSTHHQPEKKEKY